MSDAHSDVRKQVKIYIGVFVALAVFTVITVAASRIHVSQAMHVTIALVIAGFKALLVGAFFMHLRSEARLPIWGVLGLCVVFGAALLALPSLISQDMPPGVRMGTWG